MSDVTGDSKKPSKDRIETIILPANPYSIYCHRPWHDPKAGVLADLLDSNDTATIPSTKAHSKEPL